MALIKWEPWGEMDRLFDELPSASLGRWGFDLAVDVYEEGGNVVAKMQLPGIDPAKLDVSVEGDYLHVKGGREEEKEEKGKQFYRKEIRKGAFERMVALPAPVDGDKVDAVYERGELKVTMPRKEKAHSTPKCTTKHL